MHIYDFITDEFQYGLKDEAAKSIPFETSLAKYQQLFFENFDTLNAADNAAQLHADLKADPQAMKWLSDFTALVKSDETVLLDLFKDIREVYDIFLRGNHLS